MATLHTIRLSYFILMKSYNQGQKSLDRLSLLSSIHPFTALKWNFCPLWDGIVILNYLSQSRIPPSHPLSQCCDQQWHPCHYGVDQLWKWGVGKIPVFFITGFANVVIASWESKKTIFWSNGNWKWACNGKYQYLWCTLQVSYCLRLKHMASKSL